MKGLILKDLYMTVKYCKANIILSLLFLVISLCNRDSLFLSFYPALLCGIIPTNLLAYDEKSRWLQYSEALPYTRAQVVSGKYSIGLLAQLASLILVGCGNAAVMIASGTFEIGAFAVFIMLILTLSLISSSITLPFMFKYGVEKGKLAHYVMVGIVCAGSGVASVLVSGEVPGEIDLLGVLPLVCLVGVAIFALSWYLSIVFYKKREL